MPKLKNTGDGEEHLPHDDEEFPDAEFVPLEELDEAEDTDPTLEIITPKDSPETDFCTGCKEEFDLDDLCDECGECSECCVCHVTEADEPLDVEKDEDK
jgi:hypothetical protein